MNAAAGLAKKATNEATSSTEPKRAIAIASSMSDACGPVAGLRSVSTGPGWMLLMVMPFGASSRARPRVKPGDGAFGAGVDRPPGDGHPVGVDAADVDDAAPLTHAGQDFLGGEDRGAHVDCQHSVDVADGHLVQQVKTAHPCIVDQGVDRPELVDGFPDRSEHVRLEGRVCADRDGAAVLSDLLDQLAGGMSGLGVGEGDAVPVGGETPGDARTNAA